MIHIAIIDRQAGFHRDAAHKLMHFHPDDAKMSVVEYGSNFRGYRFDLVIIGDRPRNEQEERWMEDLIHSQRPSTTVVRL